MKNIGARHNANDKMLKKIFYREGKIYSGDFGCALHQYFPYYFAPPPSHPTLKYPLHTPAEKSSYFSKYDRRSKVFDYDCVTLYVYLFIC